MHVLQPEHAVVMEIKNRREEIMAIVNQSAFTVSRVANLENQRAKNFVPSITELVSILQYFFRWFSQFWNKNTCSRVLMSFEDSLPDS